MITATIARIRAWHYQRKLAKLDDWIRQLEDQVQSGQAALKYWRHRRTILQARRDIADTPSGFIGRGVRA